MVHMLVVVVGRGMGSLKKRFWSKDGVLWGPKLGYFSICPQRGGTVVLCIFGTPSLLVVGGAEVGAPSTGKHK